MKIGQEIVIIPSLTLQELRLNDLIGRKGKLIEEDLLPKHLGWWVELEEEEYLGEREWFIPLNAISAI